MIYIRRKKRLTNCFSYIDNGNVGSKDQHKHTTEKLPPLQIQGKLNKFSSSFHNDVKQDSAQNPADLTVSKRPGTSPNRNPFCSF